MAIMRVGMSPKALEQAAWRDARERQAALPWTQERIEALHEALASIAASCDEARAADGVGFSRDDYDAGHAFASSDWQTWGESAVEDANTLARRYRFTQISWDLAHKIWPLEFPE